MGIAKVRNFAYPNRSWAPGSTPITRPERTLHDALSDFELKIRKKRDATNDRLAHQSAIQARRITGERDLPPDPGEIQVGESLQGQKRWKF